MIIKTISQEKEQKQKFKQQNKNQTETQNLTTYIWTKNQKKKKQAFQDKTEIQKYNYCNQRKNCKTLMNRSSF